MDQETYIYYSQIGISQNNTNNKKTKYKNYLFKFQMYNNIIILLM